MERLAKERGDDGRDNRSFLAKYVSRFLSILYNFIRLFLIGLVIVGIRVVLFGWGSIFLF